MAMLTSAGGLLALLEEPSDVLKVHALKSLNSIVHSYWAEIASSVALVEALFEDEGFAERELAALIASKVFFHLGELGDALTYALGAGKLFDVADKSEFSVTLAAKCIDQYVELCNEAAAKGEPPAIDGRLVAIVERMFERCLEEEQFEQVVGLALEARRLDKLEAALAKCNDVTKLLQYSLKVAQTHVLSREFRHKVLDTLVKEFMKQESPDYISVCECLMFLDEPDKVAEIFEKLVKGTPDDTLLAYQVALDLAETQHQKFLRSVVLKLPESKKVAAPPANAEEKPDEPASEGGEAQAEAMQTDSSTEPAPAAEETGDSAYEESLEKLKSILSGEVPTHLYLDFLYEKNHSDLQILKNIKNAVETRNSVCHAATIQANALMHAGTTVDTFLRENLDWLSRATNWAKFSATAGLGVIHKGHTKEGRSLLQPYLPQNGSSGSPYSEGGALYALGLIHANHGENIRGFLLESLQNTSHEVIQHGASLALGLACLGTCEEDAYDEMKAVLYTDNAVAGEAAGIGMGLLLAGSASDKTEEMLTYAHDTQHEKIIRGLSLGIAMTAYEQEEGADVLVEQLTRDQDPIIRYGGVFALGLAYVGSANNSAIRQLLHMAVSDVADDVRRAAVMNLGFVLCNRHEQCPKIVSLLAESYNPHLRYGAAMACGIACAGTGCKEATDLIEPLLSDTVDYVRQGAVVAMAMILIQQPESRVASLRKQLDKYIGDKHEETLCKMGAILASGILDGAGRNATISLRSASGYNRIMAVLGVAVFTHSWFWYPNVYFIALAFQPTALIGLNKDLRVPKFDIPAKGKPSSWAYPPPLSTEKQGPTSKAATAILSTTHKNKKLKEKKKAEEKEAETKADGADAQEMDEEKAEPAADKKEEEPNSTTLSNPCRVLSSQVKDLQWSEVARYKLVKNGGAGILMLKDETPEEPEELVDVRSESQQNSAATPVEEEEPPAPEPFHYEQS